MQLLFCCLLDNKLHFPVCAGPKMRWRWKLFFYILFCCKKIMEVCLWNTFDFGLGLDLQGCLLPVLTGKLFLPRKCRECIFCWCIKSAQMHINLFCTSSYLILLKAMKRKIAVKILNIEYKHVIYLWYIDKLFWVFLVANCIRR